MYESRLTVATLQEAIAYSAPIDLDLVASTFVVRTVRRTLPMTIRHRGIDRTAVLPRTVMRTALEVELACHSLRASATSFATVRACVSEESQDVITCIPFSVSATSCDSIELW